MQNPFRKNVDGVLSSIRHQIAQLDKLSADEAARGAKLEAQAKAISEKADEAAIESARASVVAGRLSALIS